ncbi:MAG: hypothetical protein H6703_14465 [Myxococcales bacterium]|nr:hypothetical protein [Myxococcales bacterium]
MRLTSLVMTAAIAPLAWACSPKPSAPADAAVTPPDAAAPDAAKAADAAPKPPAADAAVVDDKCKQSPIYPTKGVHSPCNCGPDQCLEKRAPTDPPDPRYPDTWVSGWTMYRVFNGYKDNLPPWGSPPAGLTEGADYEVSYGATYYDNTYVPASGDGTGAMMEHYEERCLPIFPISNHFTCSFVSLGDTAYFLTYEEDRPAGMPPCCLFSPYNHPPRPDFIKHLPYSAEDSAHLGGSLQAYRYIAPGDIWFAYAFYKDQWLDPDKKYLRPQSFYFSGTPTTPPDAPFVSQNYTDFRIQKPDPTKTWDRALAMCTGNPPPCQLFDPPAADATLRAAPRRDWRDVDFSGDSKPAPGDSKPAPGVKP